MAAHRSLTAHDQTSFVSIRLVKFSSAVDPSNESDKFSWKHTTQDLVVVFDSFRGGPINRHGHPSKMMKVIQGTQVLESVDIEGKIREADDIIDSLQGRIKDIRNEQLPISALVRSPLLAIRYNLPDSTIRRLQLKFASDADFNIVHNFLTRMGLRITQSIPPSSSTMPSTVTASIEPTGPSCPPSSLAHLGARPEAASSRGTGASSLNFPPVQPSISRIQQDASLGFHRPSTARMDSSSDSVFSASHLAQHPDWKSSSTIVPASTSPRGSSTLPTTISGLDGLDNFTIRPAQSGTNEKPRTPYSVQGNQPHFEDSTRAWTSQMKPPFSSPGSFDRNTNQIASAVRSHFPHLPAIAEHEQAPAHRPFTAPNSHIESLVQLIPPRRELPFRRDGSHQGSSRRSSVDLPPLPRPSFLESVKAATRVAQTASKSSDPTTVPVPTIGNIYPDHSSAAAAMDRVVTQISGEATAGSTDNLASYATQSADDRSVFISDWMMQHIEDDNFMMLCEDVMGCWRRIGLGL